MVQVIEQSREEKINMYMELDKSQLIDMLINCNDLIRNLQGCRVFVPDSRTSAQKCKFCGKDPWQHSSTVTFTTSVSDIEFFTLASR